jgi:DNA processing protein
VSWFLSFFLVKILSFYYKNNMDRKRALLLSYLFYDSPSRMVRAMARFDDAESFFLEEGVSEKSLAYYRRRLSDFDFDRVTESLRAAGVSVLFGDDERFPEPLSEIHDAPFLLYCKGDVGLLSREMLGIVGTREMSDYGKRVTEKFSTDLAPYFLIVSGMAEGVDTVAHSTVLNLGHPSVAVVGTGLDVVYPSSNHRLFEEMCVKGLVLSEFPLGVTGQAHRFPQRNRIVSGLSRGVLVVEAGEKSGALITARLAMEENREVFVVPGSIFSSQTIGTHRLIQDGAKLVMSVEDIMSEFSMLIKVSKSGVKTEKKPDLVLTDDEKKIWELLSETGDDSVDFLVGASGLSVAHVLQILTLFEVRGWRCIGLVMFGIYTYPHFAWIF